MKEQSRVEEGPRGARGPYIKVTRPFLGVWSARVGTHTYGDKLVGRPMRLVVMRLYGLRAYELRFLAWVPNVGPVSTRAYWGDARVKTFRGPAEAIEWAAAHGAKAVQYKRGVKWMDATLGRAVIATN